MLHVEQIHEWRGQDVLDRDGERIGKLDEVFYDAGTGEAVFVSVKSGLLGRRLNLVALAGATVGREYVRVAYAITSIEGVESVEDHGQLDPAAVQGAADAYGIEIDLTTRFESATLITERHAQAAASAERAEDLKQEALKRAQEVSTTRQRADDAAQDAAQAERELEQAQRAAAEAHDEAHPAAPDAPPPSSD
jgi:hypothetical protein